MTDDENEKTDENEEFYGIMKQMQDIPAADLGELKLLEQGTYNALNDSPNNVNGMIALLRLKLLQGQPDAAKALAYRIWETGGDLLPHVESLYIDCLLNLGLLEMAAQMIKPKFEEMTNSLADFYEVMVKFAIESGSINLLDKISTSPQKPVEAPIMYNFIEVENSMNYTAHFKNIQRLIVESSKNYLCVYDYAFYNDRGFPDLEIVLYFNADIYDIRRRLNEIETKINGYCASAGVQRLGNLTVTGRNIQQYGMPSDLL